MSKTLDPTNGYTVHGWMVTELGLKGPELTTYAIVHQFSQSKAGIYKGGVSYISSWLGCSRNSARMYLHNLEAKGLITAIDGRNNGVPFRDYQIVKNHIPQNLEYIPQILEGDTPKSGRGIPQNLTIDNNIDNKVDNNPSISPLQQKLGKPTISEVAEYIRQKGYKHVDPERFVAFYESNGWKVGKNAMKNWKAAVVTWEKRNKEEKVSGPAVTTRQLTAKQYEEYMRQ